jgi:hypothetical protein
MTRLLQMARILLNSLNSPGIMTLKTVKTWAAAIYVTAFQMERP